MLLLIKERAFFLIKTKAMDHYFVNTKLSQKGIHEVHVDGCEHIPNVTRRNYLGLYESSTEAINDAGKIFSNTKACSHCIENEHIRVTHRDK